MKKRKGCNVCGIAYDPALFYRGNPSRCKLCHGDYQRAYRAAHKEEMREKRRGKTYNQKWMHTHMSTAAVLGLPQFECPSCGVPKSKRAYKEGSPLCRACREKEARHAQASA